ncbi:MAG: aminoglycoside phosphotransferase family protein [Clostridiales bacterium]|jgi:hypothetical protein|nr:aminoglycoside phosphotransferase family protein [Clostridiales bacterium]
MQTNALYAMDGFSFEGSLIGIKEFGNGHINDTYLLEMTTGKFVLQRINTYVFKDPLLLMRNIQSITEYLRERITRDGGDPDRETLNIIPAKDGKSWYAGHDGSFWRSYQFISDTTVFEAIERNEDFYECGLGFGRFQQLLSEYPAGNLFESIPNFHNTVRRFQAFKDAVSHDVCGRAAECAAEIAFAAEREEDVGLHVNLQRSGGLPLRVTHNDTKLNNVLIDIKTRKAVCVIDLDTVMPGLSVNDFGDAIRFGANTAAEDERDLSKVKLSLPLFESFTKGFLAGSGGTLTPAERDNLAAAARLMTFECGLRFLTDHLEGDVYFKIHRENHNLDRARNQFALVRDMERKMDDMKRIVSGSSQ